MFYLVDFLISLRIGSCLCSGSLGFGGFTSDVYYHIIQLYKYTVSVTKNSNMYYISKMAKAVLQWWYCYTCRHTMVVLLLLSFLELLEVLHSLLQLVLIRP